MLGMIAACLPVSRAASAFGASLSMPGEAHRLVGLFSEPVSAASIGARYLANRRDDVDAARLLHEFVDGDESILARLDGMPQTQLRTFVRERIREDFLAGRTESVDGWVLSASELRLYALAALKAG